MARWKFELLMKGIGATTEGPVWDGEHLYFTHILGSRILRYDPKDRSIVEAYTDTNRTNGLAFDAEGRLFARSAGSRSIVPTVRPGKRPRSLIVSKARS